MKKLLFLSSAMALAGWSAAASAATTESPAPTADAGSSDGIVVTARKVKERAADVPIAITAIGGQQLDENLHIRMEDLNQLAPSTVVVITNGHQTTMSIRGLGNNPGSDGLENSAGVFIDGIYLGRPGMASMDLIDIKQIEQLRGPQGTLFGKNTTAGAINITTELPSLTWGAKAAVTYGNYDYNQFQGTVTGPIASDLAFRLTGYSTRRNGDVYDVANGQMVNNLNRNGARAQLLWTPSSDFSLRLIGEYAAEQQSTGAILGPASTGVALNKLTAMTAAIGGTVITNPYKGEIAPGLVVDPTGQFMSSGGPYDTGTRQGAGSAEINWKLGGFTLTSITAFRYWQYRSDSDTEGSSADVLYGGYYIQDRQWTQELRVAFPRMGKIDLIAGLYYFNQYVQTDQHQSYGPEAAAWLASSGGTPLSTATLNYLAGLYHANPSSYSAYAPLVGLLALNNTTTNTYANPLTHSIAGFGQATWHVTPRWNITGGVRVTYETKKEDVWQVPTNVVHVAISDTAPSWLITSDYHPTRNLMVYGTISHGEKAGGLNTTQAPGTLPIDKYAVPPETATNYEVGLKGEWFGGKLTVNFDLFRMDVHNYQANVLEVLPGTSTVINPIVSAGSARTQGFEFETTLSPMKGVSLHGFVAYNDAKYRSYTNAPCPLEAPAGSTICDLSGRPIVGAPKWTAGINGSAEAPITAREALYFSPEFSWRSHYFGSNDDSIYSVTGGYALLNLRAGIRDRDGHWDLSVWGRNVTNHHYINNYFNYGALLPGTYAAVFGDPATYGATLRLSM